VRLTDSQRFASWTTKAVLSPRWAATWIGVGLFAVFLVDRATGSLPFQHLYYLPIIVGALQFGPRGAWASSLAAVLFYHLANPQLLSLNHQGPDIVQVVLFVAIGLVTARLRDDAQRLEQLAGTDDLTGLHNLRAFERRLHDAIHHAFAVKSPLSILVLDLDGLKGLNDVHGHLTGAEAVRTVGGIIGDAVPPQAIACRYGGDEFVVALPGASQLAAEGTAQSILAAVRASAPTLAGKPFPRGTLSASIGVACLRPSGDRSPSDLDRLGETLFHAADSALYDAKRGGRGRVCTAPLLTGDPISVQPVNG
jgi:diguanylate cyclase (GGDEF)-like protein